jgi:hypothetical protein
LPRILGVACPVPIANERNLACLIILPLYDFFVRFGFIEYSLK